MRNQRPRHPFPGGTELVGLVLLCCLIASGCATSYIKGRLIRPAPPPPDETALLAGLAPAPPDDFAYAYPAAVRAYPTGELIVDVMVLTPAAERSWEANPGRPIAEEHAQFVAAYHTNGYNVPVRLKSTGRAGTSIVVRPATGAVLTLSRAVLGEGQFQPGSFPDLNTDYTRGITVSPITRSGNPWYACIVPVLLAGESPLRPGDSVQVRIRPARDKPSRGIEGGWHRFIVQPVGAGDALRAGGRVASGP